MSEVVLINPFEVPDEKADAVLAGWERAAAFMREQPGVSLDGAASGALRRGPLRVHQRRRWAPPQHFADAVKQMPALTDPEIRFYPGLYRVVREFG